MPGFITYSLTKVFAGFFTQGLRYELEFRGANIDIIDFHPMGVDTRQSEVGKNLLIITPEAAARSVIDDLGRQNFTFGTYHHRI